jgi:hypothetical protein
MNKIKLHILSFLLLGISALISAQTPDIEIAIDDNDEKDLINGAVLTLTMNTPKFIRDGDISPLAVDLINAPAGLSVVSVTSSSSGETGTVVLAFTPGDFDTDSANFHVHVHDTVVAPPNSPTGYYSDSILLDAHNEVATITDWDPNSLLETDMTFVTISLTGDEVFTDEANLAPGDFNLMNFPSGITVSSINQSSSNTTSTKARLMLDITNGDFDTDSTHCRVTINGDVLRNTTDSDTLASQEFTIAANVETATYHSGDSDNLDEINLDDGVVVINLGGSTVDETFTGTGDLGTTNFELIDFPAGTSIGSVNATTNKRVVINIDFAYTDFDDDSLNCRIRIDPAILTLNKPNSLYSDKFTVSSFDENPSAAFEASPSLDEYNLDGQVLTVNLTQESIVHYQSFDATDIALKPTTFPPGLSIAGASASDANSFTVTLAFPTYTDFDTDYNMVLVIEDSVLVQSGLDLETGNKFIDAVEEQPATTLTPESGADLKEYDLDGRELDLVLSQEWLVNYVGFTKDDLTLVEPPPGVSIINASASDDSNIVVTLSSPTYVDFDVDTVLKINIDPGVLVQTPAGISVDTTIIYTHVENPISTLTVQGNPLEEYELHNRVLDLWLDDEWILNPVGFSESDMAISDIPPGVDSYTAIATDSANVEITLSSTYVDFDVDTVLKLSINSGILVQQPATSWAIDTATIYRILEVPASTLTAKDSILEEYELHNRVLDLWLDDEWIDDPLSFDENDLTITDIPPGVNSITATATDSANVVITLSSTYEDFDVDTVLKLSVDPSILIQSPLGFVLDTATIHTYVESPAAVLTPELPTFYEYDLDGRYIDVFLFEEWIETPGSFTRDDITLVDGPAGLEINDISITDSANFTVTLYDTISDYDFDTDHSLKVSIDRSKLIQVRNDLVDLESSNSVTVDGYPENPGLLETPSGFLREWWLDNQSIDLKFSEEKFKYNVTITKDHFHLNGGPPGLSIDNIRNLADSSVTIDLAFDGTDFDNHYSSVEIAVPNTVLVQTTSDSLRSDVQFQIDANIEPVVSSVDIPNNKIKVGDTVDVFLFLDVPGIHADSVFELTSGNIGGYPLFGLDKISDALYESKFTVIEDQNDYYALQDLPVNNLQLDDDPVEGENFSGFISGNDMDMIDSRIPVVGNLSLISSGAKKIGDDVLLLISAFEEGLFVEDSSSINNIPLTSSNVSFADVGGGSYTITYSIEGNDPNVLEGDLEAKVHLRDTAGNISTTYPDILTNTLSIDATAPSVSSVTNITANDTAIIGSTVTFSVLADAAGYMLGDQSHINDVPYDELGLTDDGGGNYTITYTVQEGDQVVLSPNLTASIEMEDLAGNKSAAVTNIFNNDISIFTEKPIARLTGSDVICLNDTAQLFISLEGTAPWTVRYKDDLMSYYIYDIATTDYTLKISPGQSTSYQIESVIDGTGNTNTGIGTSAVTVNPLPTVTVNNLNPVYAIDVAAITLEGSPVGGTFTGPGVVTAEQTFTPSVAGLSVIVPHEIVYEYTDANTCYGADTAFVDVVEATVTWYYPDFDEFACYIDSSYLLRCVNTSGSSGQFSAPEISDPSFLNDNGDNTVTLYPSLLDWPVNGSNKQVNIVYKYLKLGVEVSEFIELDIEFFDTTRIEALEEAVFCSNEEAIEVIGNKDDLGAGFVGPGISKPVGSEKFVFNPDVANIGLNTLYYTYTSSHNCVQQDSVKILVNPTPVADYRVLDTCIFKRPVGDTIRFENLTDSAGIGVMTWDWNFGDIASGLDNFSAMQDPKHWYADPGNWTTELTATTVNGCANTLIKAFSYGDKPTAKFNWDTECFTTTPIVFSASETEHTDAISTYQWIISDLSGNEVLNTTNLGTQETLDHSFLAIDNYRIELKVESELQCRDNDVDTIYLRPYIQNLGGETGHFEDFEASAPGWLAESSESTTLQSWEFAAVDSEKFPYESIDGSKAWYTDLKVKDVPEQSWVSSPCFDFSSMRRPMVKLDIKVSSDRDRDGTALQYTTDDGQTWNNVGAIDDGSISWYNSFRILSGPGGQGEGWTGEFVFDTDPQWVKAMHELDDLRGESRVQFRMAYGSDGSSIEENEGFAFDNLWIGERSRVVLFEHFTNSGDALSKDANTKINSLMSNNSRDVIDIQYHANVSGQTDKMNEDNPAPPSARALFYGTQVVPYTILDGGGNSEEWIYDHSENPLDTLDLYTRALQDPGFDIAIQASATGGVLSVDVVIEALDTLPNQEYILYTAIVEKQITDATYAGTNGETVFHNVAKDMLPSAAGVSYIQGWIPGDKQTENLSWTIENVLNEDLVYVVAFVQDASSKEVYQASSNDPDLWATSIRDVMASGDISMLVYPNPAHDHVYLLFNEAPLESVEIQLFNHLGSMVRNAKTMPGTDLYEFDISDLSRGIYLIRTIEKGHIKGIRKLVIMD